jgi:hypothetical protein
MSFDFGQQVVCVSEAFSPCPYWRRAVSALPKRGMVYTIRSIREAHGLIGLTFFEIVSPHAHFSEGYVEPAFNSKNFRPVRRTSIAVFEEILQDAPAPADATELV